MDKFYSVEELAARYGVTLGTVYDWIRLGRLDAMKIGKRYYIKARDVTKMEKRGAKKAKAQTDRDVFD